MHVDFIGIGAQKSATSWIAECLRQHPDIHISPEKELHFFSTDAFFDQGMHAYEQRLGAVPTSAKMIGEFSTSYLASNDAPGRIHEYFPHCKIIVSLRNPIDRALSHIEHLRSRDASLRDVSDAVIVKDHPEIIANSMYGAALKRYLAFFPRTQIHVVLFDDIASHPKEVMRDIYAFLGVDPLFVPANIYQQFNTAALRSSTAYKQINSVFFFLKRSALGSMALSVLRSAGFTSQRMVWFLSRIYGKREYAPPTSRAYFKGLFTEDLETLEKITGLAVPSWKR